MPRAEPQLPEVLENSLKMRIPRYDREASSRRRIDDLEDYLLETTYVAADLGAERIEWEKRLLVLEDEWSQVTGWQEHRRTKTEAAVTAAKRMVNPTLFNAMEDVKWIIKRITREIDRMESDAAKASRAFAMEVGSQ